jgi:hypothetical protein
MVRHISKQNIQGDFSLMQLIQIVIVNCHIGQINSTEPNMVKVFHHLHRPSKNVVSYFTHLFLFFSKKMHHLASSSADKKDTIDHCY